MITFFPSRHSLNNYSNTAITRRTLLLLPLDLKGLGTSVFARVHVRYEPLVTYNYQITDYGKLMSSIYSIIWQHSEIINNYFSTKFTVHINKEIDILIKRSLMQ